MLFPFATSEMGAYFVLPTERKGYLLESLRKKSPMNWKSCCLTSCDRKRSTVSIAFNTATDTSLGSLYLLNAYFQSALQTSELSLPLHASAVATIKSLLIRLIASVHFCQKCQRRQL